MADIETGDFVAGKNWGASLSQATGYRLLHDAYYGIGLFERGYGLRPHPREMISNYRERQALAYYLNYTGPIVNAAVDPIFKDEIKRDYNDSEMFSRFLDNCDRTGMSYQDFCKSAAQQAKLYGVVYVVVDNSDEQDETLDKAIANRHLPYLKTVMPDQIKDWALDETGRLAKFVYEERIRNTENAEIVRTYTWTATDWSISSSGDQGGNRNGEHGLGVVPVVQWLARNTPKTDILPPSEYISIAQTNYFLYQLCSWHTQLLRDQAFSILTMPDSGEDDITIGTNNVLTYAPESAHTPEFIAPAAAPADMLTGQMDRLIKEMFRMSGLDSVIGVQSDSSKSGVAKQWDFEKTNRRLADFSVRCENADKAIIDLYEKWSGESVDYEVEYPRDFKINDVADSLADAQAALDLGFGSTSYKQEVLKKVLEAYMPNLEPEKYDKIIDEVAKAAEDQEMANAYGTASVGEDLTDGPITDKQNPPAV